MLGLLLRVGVPQVTYTDTFTVDGPIGATEVGAQPWTAVTGTWSRASGLAHTSTADSSNPLIVLDVADPNVDLTCAVSTRGGGDCLYVRVVDATNWIRLRTVLTITGYTYGDWVYGGTSTLAPGDDAYGHPGTYINGNTEVIVGGDGIHYTYYTRSQTPNYAPSAVLEKSIAGTVTTIATLALGSPASTLRVVALNASLSVYINSTFQGAYTDTTNLSATKHGLGRGTSAGTTGSALDNFSLTTL